MDRLYDKDKYITPPGTLTQILSHPCDYRNKAVELSLFNEHRFAFFFWNKWTKALIKEDSIKEPPCLISLDRHQDLRSPEMDELKELFELNLESNREVSLYAWEKLLHFNDTHIVAATYLNLIGDIYIHCRQGYFEEDWKDEAVTDKYGNNHRIKKFKNYMDLESHLIHSKDITHVYFDIDLDYFTVKNPLQWGSNDECFKYLTHTEINELLNVDRPLIEWIFSRLCGITIAIEPQHTGGLIKAHRLLKFIDRLWFSPSLFTGVPGKWDKCTKWKHLKNNTI